jgi:hypothetical protein
MHAEHADSSELNEFSGRVIGCAFTVLNTLGAGFLDLLIDDLLLVELKTRQSTGRGAHAPGRRTRGRMECTNYLKATGLRLCLQLDLGKPRMEIKRVAQDL